MRRSLSVVAVCLLAFAGAAMANNLLVNGSFESGGTAPGWIPGGNYQYTYVDCGNALSVGAQSGSCYLDAGPMATDGTLSQTVATTSGASYELSVWVASVTDSSVNYAVAPNDFNMSWNGTQVFGITDIPQGGYIDYTATVTGTGSDTFTLGFRDDPWALAIDNASITASTTPEPTSIVLLGSGLIGIAGYLRKRF